MPFLGFLHATERQLFRALIKVNGVGPKLALSILSSITPEEFVQCIYHQDTSRLIHIPGIGKKTAERLIIEIRDSLAHWGHTLELNSSNQPQKPVLTPEQQMYSRCNKCSNHIRV